MNDGYLKCPSQNCSNFESLIHNCPLSFINFDSKLTLDTSLQYDIKFNDETNEINYDLYFDLALIAVNGRQKYNSFIIRYNLILNYVKGIMTIFMSIMTFFLSKGISLVLDVPENMDLGSVYGKLFGKCPDFGRKFKWRFMGLILPLILSIADSITGK